MVWGRKRLAAGWPAPNLGIPEIYIPSDSRRKALVDGYVQRNMAIAKELPLVEVYYTGEELKRRVSARDAARGPLPLPLVLKFNNVSS